MTETETAGGTEEVADAPFSTKASPSDTPVQITTERAGRPRIAALDAGADARPAFRFQVASIPAMILLKGGRPMRRTAGGNGKMALLRELSGVVPGCG